MSGLIDPAENAFAITPSNTSDLDHITRGIIVGGAGDIKVDMVSGETVVISGLAAGGLYALRLKRVYSTATTATALTGVY